MIAEFIITMLGAIIVAILGCITYQKTGKTITDERK